MKRMCLNQNAKNTLLGLVAYAIFIGLLLVMSVTLTVYFDIILFNGGWEILWLDYVSILIWSTLIALAITRTFTWFKNNLEEC